MSDERIERTHKISTGFNVLVVHPEKLFSAKRLYPDQIVIADHRSADPDKWEMIACASKDDADAVVDRIRG